MPFPNSEVLRKAVEKYVLAGLEASGYDWTAVLPDGTEVEFQPAAEFTVIYCLDDDEIEKLKDDQPAERGYTLRVKVELVGVEDVS